MKKLLALILTLVLVVGTLASCAGTQTPASPSPSTTPSTGGGETAAPTDDGTVYTIKIDYPNSENSAIYPVLKQWEAYVEEKSNKRIDIEIYSGGALGSLFDCVTNCESGVTDGFWSGVTIYAGVFPNTEVMGLPMIGANNQQVANAVLKDLLNETEFLTEEWSPLHVMAIHSSTASPILFSGKVVDSVDDMAGMNLRISNAYTTEWFSQLGANPVSVGINDGYENIQKNVIQGGLFFFDQVQSSELYEVVDSLLMVDSIYPLTMFCLNKDVYAGLPTDLQAVVDDSAEYFQSLLPDVYDKQLEDMMVKCEEAGVEIVEADDAMRTEMKNAAQSSWDKWVEKIDSLGYDGKVVLDKTLELIEKYNAVYPG